MFSINQKLQVQFSLRPLGAEVCYIKTRTDVAQ